MQSEVQQCAAGCASPGMWSSHKCICANLQYTITALGRHVRIWVPYRVHQQVRLHQRVVLAVRWCALRTVRAVLVIDIETKFLAAPKSSGCNSS